MEPYQQLEKEYAKFTQSKYAVSCSSGTAGLHLALAALGIGPGDEVIVPDFAMAAVAFAVSYTGAVPKFADVYIDSYGMRIDEIKRCMTQKTKAIIIVHTYGRVSAALPYIIEFARAMKIAIIEDACEAQGAIHNSEADMTVYSFYKNKIIAAEEGGMVTTNKKKYADKINYLKNMAFGPKHDYFHKAVGFNYRMTNAMARMALASLGNYVAQVLFRTTVEDIYMRRLPTKPRNAVWFYEVKVKNKAEILRKVSGARDAFKPLSSFPMYGGGEGKPNSRKLASELVLLPVTISEGEIIRICNIVKQKNG